MSLAVFLSLQQDQDHQEKLEQVLQLINIFYVIYTLIVCFYPIKVKLLESPMSKTRPRKVGGWSECKKCASKHLDFRKVWKIPEKNPRTVWLWFMSRKATS